MSALIMIENLEQMIAELHDKLKEIEKLTYQIEAEVVKLYGTNGA